MPEREVYDQFVNPEPHWTSEPDEEFEYWWEDDEEKYDPPSHFVDEEGNCWVEVNMTDEETIGLVSHLIGQEEKN